MMACSENKVTCTTSSYYKSLEAAEQTKYDEKLVTKKKECLPDPFTLNNWKRQIHLMPRIAWLDIYNYLIKTPSQFTHSAIKAYKSLKAYNYFVCGHVQEIYYHDIEAECRFCFIKSKVILDVTFTSKNIIHYIFYFMNNIIIPSTK